MMASQGAPPCHPLNDVVPAGTAQKQRFLPASRPALVHAKSTRRAALRRWHTEPQANDLVFQSRKTFGHGGSFVGSM